MRTFSALFGGSLLAGAALGSACGTNAVVGNPREEAVVTTRGKLSGLAPYVEATASSGSFTLAAAGAAAPIVVSAGELPGVKRVVGHLRADVARVTGGAQPALAEDAPPSNAREVVIIGTLGQSELVDGLVTAGKLDVTGVSGKWDTFVTEVVEAPMSGVDRALVIAGSNKRGTIYGIYDLSSQLGVSPWYYWADVPAPRRPDLHVKAGRYSPGEPKVKYRGFFINDENPALLDWANASQMGFKRQLYEKVFELVLRLRGNYLWPAMWGKAFNADDAENPRLADEYGVIMGTSHHEPMMRAQREWADAGHTTDEWNYAAGAATMRTFWQDGVTRMGAFESLVTIGMRGDGDESFANASVLLMQTIVADQRSIIAQAATFSAYGVQVSGGMAASFSDMLGDRLLFAEGQVGNSWAMLGGQLVFVNRRHRWNWGVGLNAIPNMWGYATLTQNPDGTREVNEYIVQQSSRGPTGILAYPFSAATRVEFAGDLRRVSMSQRITRVAIDPNGRGTQLDRTTEPIAGPFDLAEGRVALVHDTTYFGATSPLFGERYRVEIGKSSGTLSYTNLLLDWRRYFMPKKPVTFGVRIMHLGRYGRDEGQENLTPAYLGYAEYVHGYGVGSFSVAECTINPTMATTCGIFKNLLGTRMLVTNFEVRAPLRSLVTGELQYGRVPIDVAAFFDAGVTWGSLDSPFFQDLSHRPIRSAGFATRFNVFGFFLTELSLARAFDRADRNWQWQFTFRQGF